VKKVLSILALCLGYSTLWAQSQSSASLNFVIVIPRFTEITADTHPATTELVSEQQIQLHTNQRSTCVQLINRTGIDWSTTKQTPGWSQRAADNSYRFCTNQIGRLSLNLTHQFSESGQTWPLHVTWAQF